MKSQWDNARVFLAVSRGGSFRAAAKELGLSVNAVRRSVSALEASLNRRLMERTPMGIVLMPAGEEVVIAAERMASAYFDMGTPSRQLRMEFGQRQSLDQSSAALGRGAI